MTYQQRKISRSVFRAYDIRGIIGQELDEDAFYSIGLAIAYRLSQLNQTSIFLARDGRLTSPDLALALKQGLLQSGIHVIDLGAVTTPLLYYATHTHEINSGLMVTGSHNPRDYNGIKIVIDSKTFVQEDITQLYAYVLAGESLKPVLNGKESAEVLFDKYSQAITKDIHLKRPLKVVVDCGNGIGGPFVPQVLRDLGCEVIPLYCEVDGRFLNHHPDPSVEANLASLKTAVAAHQADVGLAFDGDADRLGVISNTGEMISPDRLMMLYAKELLSRQPGATIVFDVKCSALLEQVIKEHGGLAKMCPTGHSIVKSVMKKEGALFAGEMSGHLFFKDRWFGFDDALYSACRFLEIISASPLSVAEQFQWIPKLVSTPELKIQMADDKKFQFMQDFCDKAFFEKARLVRIDGLRVEFETGWGLLRASNTTPCLIARFEALDEENLIQIQECFKAQILKLDPELALPF